MTKTTNQAAWQQATGRLLEIGTADSPSPAGNQILIRNRAIAVNPLDRILQDFALLPWLDYPAIFGSDVAGEVIAVGVDVKRFTVGDRVLGLAVGMPVNDPAQGAFQEHTIVLDHMAAPIPDHMAFADAAVLPLGLGTAASGLYGETHLALTPPSHSPASNPDIVLVWGASSSVGCNAVQLAVASGYRCVAIASERNADMLKTLGADTVLDHASPTIVEDVIETMRGRRLAGTLHATGNMDDCFAVVRACEGSHKVAVTLAPRTDIPAGIEATHIFGTALKDDAIGPLIFGEFLPEALATGTFVPAPPANVVGQGIEKLQLALDTLKAGVSASKVVVTLP